MEGHVRVYGEERDVNALFIYFESKMIDLYCILVIYLTIWRSQQIFIKGLESINRAIQDDVVAVELLPKEEWTKPSGLVCKDVDDHENENVETVGLEVIAYKIFVLFRPLVSRLNDHSSCNVIKCCAIINLQHLER